jgi:hypothetical protein
MNYLEMKNEKPEWVKSVGSLIQTRIKKLNGHMSTRSTSIFREPNVAKHNICGILHEYIYIHFL